jgi:hypothetical protein
MANITKTHITVDFGPSTVIILSELLLVALKTLNYIQLSWMIVLSPILLVICGATLILLFTLIKLIKEYIF